MNSFLTNHTTINLKWAKDLNVRRKTEPTEKKKNLGEILQDLDIDNDFLNGTLIVQEIPRIDIWHCVKFKSFSTAKEATVKTQTTLGEKSLSVTDLTKD